MKSGNTPPSKLNLTMDINVHVGRRIRSRRTTLGLTQEVIAKSLGVSFQQVQKYEKGKDSLNIKRLYEFSKTLDVPIEYFFEGLTEKNMPIDPITTSFASTREILEVIKAFKNVRNHWLRRKVSDLLRELVS